MYIPKYTIYGERCSGTNYLEDVVNKNFDVELTWDYGWKHFFGFQEEQLKNSDNILFICIIRDIQPWLNSFFRVMHHLPLKYVKNITEEEKIRCFLEDEFYSIHDINKKEIMTDRNIYTSERYKNIFEMRFIKNKFMKEDLPQKVKHYLFIQYEDLVNDFENTIIKIKDKGLKVKEDIHFPINSKQYKNSKNEIYKKKNEEIPITKEMIQKYI